MNKKLWETEVAERFIAECSDPEWDEFINNWINDKTYVFPFHKPVTKDKRCRSKMDRKIENKSISVINNYYTQLVREQLIKMKK